MTRFRIVGFAVTGFAAGVFAGAGLAQSKGPAFTPDLLSGDAKAVAAKLLEGALQLAGTGSWDSSVRRYTLAS